MRKKLPMSCPCGSGKTYRDCCGCYIAGEKIPEPEALMRSRYTAYTQANIDYIQATMCGKAAHNFNSLAAEQWAKSVKWVRLKVFKSFPHETDENRYYVQFNAYYMYEGKPGQIDETSEFQRINDRWYYVDKL